VTHGDEIPVRGTGVKDVDLSIFEPFYEKVFGEVLDQEQDDLWRLFGKFPSYRLPVHLTISSPGRTLKACGGGYGRKA